MLSPTQQAPECQPELRLSASVYYWPHRGLGHIDANVRLDNLHTFFVEETFLKSPEGAIEIKLPSVSISVDAFIAIWNTSSFKYGDGYSLWSNNCAHNTLRLLRLCGFTQENFDQAILLTPYAAAQEACRIGQTLLKASHESKMNFQLVENKACYQALQGIKKNLSQLFLNLEARLALGESKASGELKEKENEKSNLIKKLDDNINQCYNAQMSTLNLKGHAAIQQAICEALIASRDKKRDDFLKALLVFESHFQHIFHKDRSHDACQQLKEKIRLINQEAVLYPYMMMSTLFTGGGVLLHYYACMQQWVVLGVCVGAMGGPVGLAVTLGVVLTALLVLTCAYLLLKACQSQPEQRPNGLTLVRYALPVTFFSSGAAVGVSCLATMVLAGTAATIIGGPVGLMVSVFLFAAISYYLCLRKARVNFGARSKNISIFTPETKLVDSETQSLTQKNLLIQ